MFIKPNESNATLFLFLISGLGYAVTYTFEWGYLKFFGLPSSFITIHLSAALKNILLIAGMFASFYILNYFASRLFNWLFSKKGLSFRQRVESAAKRKKSFMTFLVVLISTAVLMFFFIYKAVMDPAQFQYVYAALVLAVVLYQFSDPKYLKISFVLFLLFFTVLAYFFGYNSASAQVTYVIVDHAPNEEKEAAEKFVVVRSFGSKAIIAKADFQKKTIYSEYQLISMEAQVNKLKFKRVHTGRLTVTQPAAGQ